MTISGRVVRASRATRGLVAFGLVTAWVLVVVLVLQLTLEGLPPLSFLVAVPFGVVTGLAVVVVDASSRREQARRAGWWGDPDLLAVVAVDADQGVLPTTEPERELAYRHAVRAWNTRWTVWIGAVVVTVVQVATAGFSVALSGWTGAAFSLPYVVVPLLLVHRAVVVLLRLRRIIRTVEGR